MEDGHVLVLLRIDLSRIDPYLLLTNQMKATVLYPSQCLLGEGPIWHTEKKCCYWVAKYEVGLGLGLGLREVDLWTGLSNEEESLKKNESWRKFVVL